MTEIPLSNTHESGERCTTMRQNIGSTLSRLVLPHGVPFPRTVDISVTLTAAGELTRPSPCAATPKHLSLRNPEHMTPRHLLLMT